MSSSETGRLVLTSRSAGTRLTIVDSTLRPFATIHGSYDGQLPVGVYQVEGQLGGAATTLLVTVRPGQEEHVDLTVQFAAAAPAEGSSTSNETHGDLVSTLSGEIAHAVGPDAGLALVLRNLRGALPSPLQTESVELLDSRLRRVSEWPSDWVRDDAGNIAARAGRLLPGPYVLRTHSQNDDGTVDAIDQTVWLSRNWQTLVFVPNTSHGPEARGGSVQMTRLTVPWLPRDQETLAVEAALAGLREGVASVAPDLMKFLLWGKYQNPMLGILGLHALLLGPPPEHDMTATVVKNLQRLVGDHPDVQALAARLPEGHGAQRVSVTWPPMLETSYRRCLLPADLADPEVLPEGSPAERVAAYVRGSGPWLLWSATQELISEAKADDTSLESAPRPGDGRVRAPKAATRQVSHLLNQMAEFHDIGRAEVLDQMGTAELASRAHLPETLVVAALRELGLAEPVTTAT